MDGSTNSDWLPLLISLILLAGILLVIWRLLSLRRQQQYAPSIELIHEVNRLLPQTQCGQCGYAGCRPYARAMLQGESINRCPPGGLATIGALARLLHRPVLPLDPACGEIAAPKVAFIREAECIGCTKCIQACPVDAIVGAAKLMHTVIRSECTGCDLCVEPCPVDCIDMLPTGTPA